MGFFKNLDQEQPLFDDLINLCTPVTIQRTCLTLRNLKILTLAIFNIYLPWMNEQDRSEWEGFYHHRIHKYRLFKEKLPAASIAADYQADALSLSCQESPLSLS
jgi:hypothetical protein